MDNLNESREKINKIDSEMTKLFVERMSICKEIAEYIGLNSVSYAIKKYVQPLIDSGRIKLTVSDAPSSPNQKYYSQIYGD